MNFVVTPNGLDNLLLAIIVARERPDIEAEKNQLITQKVDTER